ncbi:hypothetical protein [Planctomicrobium sp. SH664]|uniref:hypothetical protein n=1 Tax=Planctomicrobium sp. SH664 TaxID=3448125 RepID=UPI003F5C3339
MPVQSLPERYSSTVQLNLIVGSQTIELSRIGPRSVVLKKGMELPRCRAEIIMRVDGRIRKWAVKLVHGAVPYEREVEITDV